MNVNQLRNSELLQTIKRQLKPGNYVKNLEFELETIRVNYIALMPEKNYEIRTAYFTLDVNLLTDSKQGG